MHGFQLSVKDKGRMVIPVALRKEACLADAETLVATVLPDGGFTVRTREQILNSLWAQALEPESQDLASAHIRESAISYAQRSHELDNPSISNHDLSDSEEAAILAKLGL